jgi:hypothetical protein
MNPDPDRVDNTRLLNNMELVGILMFVHNGNGLPEVMTTTPGLKQPGLLSGTGETLELFGAEFREVLFCPASTPCIAGQHMQKPL